MGFKLFLKSENSLKKTLKVYLFTYLLSSFLLFNIEIETNNHSYLTFIYTSKHKNYNYQIYFYLGKNKNGNKISFSSLIPIY